jgi:hypothetical protein
MADHIKPYQAGSEPRRQETNLSPTKQLIAAQDN